MPAMLFVKRKRNGREGTETFPNLKGKYLKEFGHDKNAWEVNRDDG